MVIWVIGMSGAGKTTLGSAMAQLWRTRAPGTVLVDGDAVRRLFGQHDGEAAYTLPGRRANAERITALCEWLDGQSLNVVCCILSVFADMRAQNRTRFSRYYEIYLHAPLAALAQRDSKDLYGAAMRGERRNVVGVDIAFEAPTSADLTLDTSGPMPDVQALAHRVLTEAGAW